MNETEQDIGFAEFEAAFADENQVSEPETNTGESGQKQEETHQEPESATETGENSDGETSGSEDKKPAEGQEQPDTQEETFTLRVNKEDRTVSRDEVISLAQKGADYDRVKGQLAESRATVDSLNAHIGKYQEAIDTLTMISESSGMDMAALVQQLHVNMLMKSGKTEAEAKAEIRAQKAEKALEAARKQESEQKTRQEDISARAQREVEEFHRKFPNVELTKELCESLSADVQSGMTLSEAYTRKESAQKDQEIAELKRRLEAEKKNKRNQASSPGSQNDSGGRREKSDFDDFMSEFA